MRMPLSINAMPRWPHKRASSHQAWTHRVHIIRTPYDRTYMCVGQYKYIQYIYAQERRSI